MTPFQWLGSKSRMSERVINYLLEGAIYVEPFCGSAAIFFNKEPHQKEVLNDLDSNIINLFKTIQNKDSCRIVEEKIKWTLYSREEFTKALTILKLENPDPIERAWAFYVTQNQGFSGNLPKSSGNWGRVFMSAGDRARTTSQWENRQYLFEEWNTRLLHTTLTNTDALECIKYWDSSKTVFYIDPPYIKSTRRSGDYGHEINLIFHKNLCKTLLNTKGKAILSGYNDDSTYQPLLENGWFLIEMNAICHSASKTRTTRPDNGKNPEDQRRTECLWIKGSKRNLFN